MESAEFHDCLVIYHGFSCGYPADFGCGIVFHWPNNDDFLIVSPE